MPEPQAKPGAGTPPPYSPAMVAVITVCTVMATLMQSLDGTIANVALPYMQGAMSASQDEINWVLTSYIMAAAIMTAPTGFFAARFGRTRLYTISITGFTLSSILCGASQSLDEIIFFRVTQGLCGAALVPLSQSVLFDLFPLEKRGVAMSLWGIGVQIGPILGPILGGWLTQNYSWRWVFYINVPFGIISAVGVILLLRETPRSQALRMDWTGFIALSLGLAALQAMLDRGQTLDWFSSREITAEAIVAALGFYIFTVQFTMAPAPFVSPKLFADRNFMATLIFIFVVGVVLFATLALLAPYLQELMQYPVVTAGIVLAPRGLGTVLALLVCGRLVGRVNPRWLITLGLVIGAWALYNMTQWDPDVSQRTIVVNGFIQGAGIGFVFVPLSTVGFATMPLELRTQATGVFSLMRNLGSAVGISVTSAMLDRNTQTNHAIIGSAISPFNHALQTGAAALYWNPLSLRGAAALNAVITNQATTIAYTDDFKLMLVLTLLAFPCVLLIGALPLPGVKRA